MKIRWTDEALDDLAEIVAYYYREAGPRTAASIQRRILTQLDDLLPFPERVRKSERIPGARELVFNRLPYIAFVRVLEEEIQVLNVVHAARKFPP